MKTGQGIAEMRRRSRPEVWANGHSPILRVRSERGVSNSAVPTLRGVERWPVGMAPNQNKNKLQTKPVRKFSH